jgi:hypothetical protein
MRLKSFTAVIVGVLAQSDYPNPAQDSLEHTGWGLLLRLIVVVAVAVPTIAVVVAAALFVVRRTRSSRIAQGHRPLNPQPGNVNRRRGNRLLLTDALGGTTHASNRLSAELRQRHGWNVVTGNRFLAGQESVDSLAAVVPILDGSWAPRDLQRRDHPLRHALQLAFDADADVVPVQIDEDDLMPHTSELPASLAKFGRLNAQTLHTNTWAEDVAILAEHLARVRTHAG